MIFRLRDRESCVKIVDKQPQFLKGSALGTAAFYKPTHESNGRREYMEPRKRRTGVRFWGILGALWLVIGCVAGCKTASDPGLWQPAETTAVQETAKAETAPETSGVEEAADAKEPGEALKAADSKEPGEAPKAADAKEPGETPKAAGASEPSEMWESVEAADNLLESREIDTKPQLSVEESGLYSSKDEVALYIHLYGHLPDNYITKKEAENLGWNSKEGNLWQVAPDMSIGGSRFGNYEGALPDKKGRKYYECDIDFDGGYRGAKRIIYSDDGLIFYTEDHYKTFEQLYGD